MNNGAALLVIAVLLGVTTASVIEKDDNGILILTNDTFKSAVEDNKLILVQFCKLISFD